ncbi:MAG: argininosuccinate synthase [Bacteroidales bacterium]|jgi:argininosuccinate synthase|nr:argininosuccinate synthase [Bacteroidales bacterium]MDD2569815.1 argininosuccinate synthase [Bacteroidales bacterium]MDD2812316.1 argininosuccinate synthase [Bacteroidales bacterium]MDD3384967.1 argininosuccinate synthase [Bacteroidales bacterium]MDD3811561.1 argininosuccinate synthase [Bacteroidales bacterium]
MKKKVVLAYSGGLDTSVILKWLINKGYDVICYVGDVGQVDNFDEVKEKALTLGATKVYVEDLKRELVVDYIFPALRGNALYEGRYLLGTAIARPLIAKRQVEIALKENCNFLAHGATGKGNDQVRFEFVFYALHPEATIISPWKDPEFLQEFKGRTDMIRYAEKYQIPVKVTAAKTYSEDDNLLHISHEAGILEDPAARCPENVYSKTLSPFMASDSETLVEIEFENGTPVRILNLEDGTEKTDPLELFEYANHIAGVNGIGRLDMVENRFIGIKSRGVYETPGGYLLWEAHRDLEGIAMDKEVMHLRDMLIPKFSELIYNGLWFSPEMDFLMAAFNKSQEQITGKVVLSLYKGNAQPVYRESPVSLYDKDLSSMDIEGGFDATDTKGFININAIRLKAHHLVLRKQQPYQWRPTYLKP